MARKHTEDEVLKSLRKKHDVRVIGRTVQLLKNKIHNKENELVLNPAKIGDVGNGTNGKIDFLVKYCGYSVIFLKEF